MLKRHSAYANILEDFSNCKNNCQTRTFLPTLALKTLLAKAPNPGTNPRMQQCETEEQQKKYRKNNEKCVSNEGTN